MVPGEQTWILFEGNHTGPGVQRVRLLNATGHVVAHKQAGLNYWYNGPVIDLGFLASAAQEGNPQRWNVTVGGNWHNSTTAVRFSIGPDNYRREYSGVHGSNQTYQFDFPYYYKLLLTATVYRMEGSTGYGIHEWQWCCVGS